MDPAAATSEEDTDEDFGNLFTMLLEGDEDGFMNLDFGDDSAINPFVENQLQNWSDINIDMKDILDGYPSREPVQLHDGSEELLETLNQNSTNGEDTSGIEVHSTDSTDPNIIQFNSFDDWQFGYVEVIIENEDTSHQTLENGSEGLPYEILGDFYLISSDNSGTSRQHQTNQTSPKQSSDSNESTNSVQIKTVQIESNSTTTATESANVPAVENVKNYFQLPIYEPKSRKSGKAKTGQRQCLKKKVKLEKVAAKNEVVNEHIRILTKPTHEELLELATFPGDPCFDPKQKLTALQLRLIRPQEKNKSKNEDQTNFKRVDRHRRFRSRRRIQRNQLVYHAAYLELLNEKLKQDLWEKENGTQNGNV